MLAHAHVTISLLYPLSLLYDFHSDRSLEQSDDNRLHPLGDAPAVAVLRSASMQEMLDDRKRERQPEMQEAQD